MAQVDTKMMLDDVRARDTALLNLLLTNDRQAMDLFRIYVTIGSATAVAAASGFLQPESMVQTTRWATLTITGILAIASCLCHLAMASLKVGLPGKDADFWEWAQLEGVTDENLTTTYLRYSREHQNINREAGDKASERTRWAKRLGIIAPLAGLLVGAATNYLTLGGFV